MNPVWAGVLAALLGGGLLTATWNIFKDWRKGPLDSRDAHIAAADTIQGMALKAAVDAQTRADAAMTEAKAAREEAKVAKVQADADRGRIAATERTLEQVRSVLSRWESWGRDIHARWDFHRAQPSPPSLPHLTEHDYPPPPQ